MAQHSFKSACIANIKLTSTHSGRIQPHSTPISPSLSTTTNAQLITLGDKNAFRSGSNAMQIYEQAEANINL